MREAGTRVVSASSVVGGDHGLMGSAWVRSTPGSDFRGRSMRSCHIETPGRKPNRLAYVHRPITFVSSALTPGLQVADLIAYLYRRYDGHTQENTRTRVTVEALWGILSPVWGKVWVWMP